MRISLLAAILISLAVAAVSGYVLFGTTAHRGNRAIDIIFGLAVAIFIVSIVTVITRRVARLIGEDHESIDAAGRDRDPPNR